MLKTVWKSPEEIKYSLRDAKRIAIFSCGFCASLSETGGLKGMKFLRGVLEEWGKEVVVAKCINVCCSETIMTRALRVYRKPISKCDALIVLSCGAGVKSAFLCNPGIPVIAALDSVGSRVISRQDDPVARSICTACGRCVITYTGGICPMSECPTKRRYEPCNESPLNSMLCGLDPLRNIADQLDDVYARERGMLCALDPERECVWVEIAKRGDLNALKELGRIHKAEDQERLSGPIDVPSPALMREVSGWVMVHTSSLLARFVPWIK